MVSPKVCPRAIPTSLALMMVTHQGQVRLEITSRRKVGLVPSEERQHIDLNRVVDQISKQAQTVVVVVVVVVVGAAAAVSSSK